MNWQLAQLNIARARAPLTEPAMAGFVAALAEINALAEASPGFVWRLKDESGDATQIRAFEDPAIIVNMSVWATIDDLFAYVYRSDHAAFLARRKEWFERIDGPALVLWWVKAGHRPTLDEAKAKLMLLTEHGPSAAAFTLKRRFPAPDSEAA